MLAWALLRQEMREYPRWMMWTGLGWMVVPRHRVAHPQQMDSPLRR